MAKIRPVTPDHAVSAELHGSTSGCWEPDGLGYGKPRALTGNSSGLPDPSAAAGSVFARGGPSGSLRTEPDIDAILPLPGVGQMVNVVSPVGSEEVQYALIRIA